MLVSSPCFRAEIHLLHTNEPDGGSIKKSAVFRNNDSNRNGGAVSSPVYATFELPDDTVFEGNTLRNVSALPLCPPQETPTRCIYRSKSSIHTCSDRGGRPGNQLPVDLPACSAPPPCLPFPLVSLFWMVCGCCRRSDVSVRPVSPGRCSPAAGISHPRTLASHVYTKAPCCPALCASY